MTNLGILGQGRGISFGGALFWALFELNESPSNTFSPFVSQVHSFTLGVQQRGGDTIEGRLPGGCTQQNAPFASLGPIDAGVQTVSPIPEAAFFNHRRGREWGPPLDHWGGVGVGGGYRPCLCPGSRLAGPAAAAANSGGSSGPAGSLGGHGLTEGRWPPLGCRGQWGLKWACTRACVSLYCGAVSE